MDIDEKISFGYKKKHSARVMVANTGFPEIDQLAACLSIRGHLTTYVRPYINKQRNWERFIASIPKLSGIYLQTIGRRKLPYGLDSSLVHEAALLNDFGIAFLQRSGCCKSVWGNQFSKMLINLRTRRIGSAAARVSGKVDLVIASHGSAQPSFNEIKKRGGKAVLNYPIAHHRFARRLLVKEAELVPAFASTLSYHNIPPWLEERLNMECELADCILVGSSFVRDTFIAEGIPHEKILMVPYGSDTSLFSPNFEQRPRMKELNVLFVGQIGQRKGIYYLLEAYKRFRRIDTSLTIVGLYVGEKTVFDPYRALFRYIPHVPREYLSDIYRSADVFVLPSLIEGMPIVVLEAMASGLPVVVTPNGPVDIVRDGIDGFIVPIRDSDAIIDRLEYLRANPYERVQMGHSARKRALQFTWKAFANRAVDKILEISMGTMM